MSESYILALDQGTTGTKVVLFDHNGAIRQRTYSEFTQIYPQPGWVEHDAEEIWQTTHQLIADCLTQSGISPQQICAIGITNQRETVVLWDKQTGMPVANAIVWQDRRTADICSQFKQDGYEELIRRKTGLVIDPYFSATKIKWLLDHTDGLRVRATRGEIAFGTIDTWLLWKLTNGAVHATDYSNASRTLLYNIHELEWDDELLALFNIPAALLPDVGPSAHSYGLTAADSFFDVRVPVAGIAGDQQAALFGQTCFAAGDAKNTYGTGSFVLMNTGTQAVESRSGMLTTIAWGLGAAPVVYALEGSVFITGAAVQWLRDGLQIIAAAAETEQLAQSVSSNGGVYFVPALTGMAAPHWDAHARGSIFGLTRGTTRAHIVRATLESIAYQSRDVMEAMERDSGIQLRTIRVDGGAVGNSFLMQFQADMLGTAVEVPMITETTALGAAYLAGLATGFWSSTDELKRKWKLAQRFDPGMKDDERELLYTMWLKAVERTKGWANA